MCTRKVFKLLKEVRSLRRLNDSLFLKFFTIQDLCSDTLFQIVMVCIEFYQNLTHKIKKLYRLSNNPLLDLILNDGTLINVKG